MKNIVFLVFLLSFSISFSQKSVFDTTPYDGFEKVGVDNNDNQYSYKVESSNNDYTTWNIWFKVKLAPTKTKKGKKIKFQKNGFTLSYIVINCSSGKYDTLENYSYDNNGNNVGKMVINEFEQRIIPNTSLYKISSYLCSLNN